MNAWKRLGMVMLHLVLAGGLLLVTFCVPELLVRLTDRQAIGQVNTRKLEMNTYELTYHNFAEKLYTIAAAREEGIATQLIQMPDDEKEIDDEELTEYVVQEANELFEKMWGTKINLQAEELVKRELYMMYGDDGRNNLLPGIYVYRLVYRTEWLGCDNVEFEFFLDTQFHKLYRFSVNNQATNIVAKDTEGLIAQIERAYKEALDVVLPLEVLVQYWELEKSYSVKYDYGEEFCWKEKKNLWGKGAEDPLLLSENSGTIGLTLPLSVWSYLTCASEFNMFHMQMGIWLETEDTYVEVYDAVSAQ